MCRRLGRRATWALSIVQCSIVERVSLDVGRFPTLFLFDILHDPRLPGLVCRGIAPAEDKAFDLVISNRYGFGRAFWYHGPGRLTGSDRRPVPAPGSECGHAGSIGGRVSSVRWRLLGCVLHYPKRQPVCAGICGQTRGAPRFLSRDRTRFFRIFSRLTIDFFDNPCNVVA